MNSREGRWRFYALSSSRVHMHLSQSASMVAGALGDLACIMSFSSPEPRQKLLASRSEHPTAGDLASHGFRPYSEAGQPGVTNCRALSLRPEDLTQAADQARESKDPSRGVIIVCSGQRRAQAAFSAIINLRPANFTRRNEILVELRNCADGMNAAGDGSGLGLEAFHVNFLAGFKSEERKGKISNSID